MNLTNLHIIKHRRVKMNTYQTITTFSLLALYALPVTGAPTNFVKNGSFEFGNIGFTSDYVPSIFDGGYVITTDPKETLIYSTTSN